MSSTATVYHSAVTGSGVSFWRAVKSEWIKFTTLRSSVILLIATVAVMVGIGLLGAWGLGQGTQHLAARGASPQQAGFPSDLIHRLPAGGLDLGQLLIGALGVLLIASEYSTGMIRSTMTAIPTRTAAVLAKATVIGITSAVVGIVSVFITYFAIQPVLGSYNLQFGLDTKGVLASMLLTGVYIGLVAILALAIGSLLRNSAGGIVALVALLTVLPGVLGIFQLDFIKDYILPYLPSNAGTQMLHIDIAAGALNQWQGGLVMAAWSFGLLAIATVVTKRRDV